MWRRIGLMIYLIGLMVGVSFAQESPPEETLARAYQLILNARPENYGDLGPFVCAGYEDLPISRWEQIARDRAGADLSVDGLTFIPRYVSRDNRTAILDVSGEVAFEGLFQLPQQVRMVNDGGWKICSQDRPWRIISAADLALDEEAAQETAVQFYAAFYTNRPEILSEVTCEAEREGLKQAALENFETPAEILPTSQWNLRLRPALDYALGIETEGVLELRRIEDQVIIRLNDRADFRGARLIREGGWKFCTPFRAGESAIRRFVQGYYGAPDETWPDSICESYRAFLPPLGEAYNLEISLINLPNEVFNDQRKEAINLQALIIIGAGGEVFSVGDEFGPSARLIQNSEGAWQWCHLPLAR